MCYHVTMFTLKVFLSLYCQISISHGVENFLHGLWGIGTSDANLISGFAITPSEYIKYAVFQIWTQISVVSVSIGTRFL